MTRCLAILLLALALPLTACTAAQPPPGHWRSPLAVDHPLVGTLWDVDAAAETSPKALVRAAAAADYVLLGEKHDNPDHHRLQAWMVAQIAATGERPAVAFEMLDRDQNAALRAHLAAHPRDAAGLGAAVGWNESGWPDWAMYRPIASAALSAGLPLRAADVPRDQRRRVGAQGFGALEPTRVTALGLDRDLPAALAADLRADLMASHCDLLPAQALAPMARVQRLRDAAMADSLIRAAREAGDRAVLIAGNGHVRADRGVPWYLRARLEAPRVVTLAIIEVRAGETDWRAYPPAVPDGGQRPFDYIWFTPRIDDKDHCAELAEQLQRHGRDEPTE